MTDTPGAFLAIWNDVDPAVEAEYNRWHSVEHVPERVGVAGFRQGRRYVAEDAARHRYFTLYELEDAQVLGSPGYLSRLNDPTPWTQRMMPAFRNFVRGGCHVMASQGLGRVGGYAATLQLAPGRLPDTDAAQAMVREALQCDGVAASRVGCVDLAGTTIRTREREFRTDAPDSVFTGVLLLEGDSRHAVTQAIRSLGPRLSAWGMDPVPEGVTVYSLALLLWPASAAH